jgi:hypothetical protein
MSDSRPLRPLIHPISSPMFALLRHFLSAASCHQRSAHRSQPHPFCFLLLLSYTHLLTMHLLCCRRCNRRTPCPPFATLSPQPPCESLRVLTLHSSPYPILALSISVLQHRLSIPLPLKNALTHQLLLPPPPQTVTMYRNQHRPLPCNIRPS